MKGREKVGRMQEKIEVEVKVKVKVDQPSLKLRLTEG